MKKVVSLMLLAAGLVISAEQPAGVLQENQVRSEIIVQNQDAQKNEAIVEAQKTADATVPQELVKPTTIERETTCAIIKPDAVAAGYTGQIVDLIEKNGFAIARMQKKTLTAEHAKLFYAAHKEKLFYADLVAYMSSGPIIVLELEKENAVADWRALIGQTDPVSASVGTLRKMFGTSKTHNAVHGSDSRENALQEIALLLNPE